MSHFNDRGLCGDFSISIDVIQVGGPPYDFENRDELSTMRIWAFLNYFREVLNSGKDLLTSV